MHKLTRFLWLAAVFCSLASDVRVAAAADIAIFPAEAPSLLPSDAIAVGELLAQAYAATSRSAVLAPSRTAQTLASSQTYQQAATTLGVAEFVRSSALAVGRRIVVSATRHRADGQLVYQESLIADSSEDLVPVCERIAKALHFQQPDEVARTYRNVTLSESRPQNRLWHEKLFGVKAAVHVPFARNARLSPTVGVAFDMRLELASWFVEFGAGIMIPSPAEDLDGEYEADGSEKINNRGSTGGLFAEVGANRFLTQGDIGLYAGGGVMPKILFSDDGAGMALFGQLGLTMPRESSTRFSTDLRFAQSVLPQHLNNGRAVFPSEASLHAGIGW